MNLPFKKFALGFSGGCDSAYLLAWALKNGCDVAPYYIKSPFQPEFELTEAKNICAELGTALKVLPLDTLALPEIVENTPQRCYYCKRCLFRAIAQQASTDGYDIVCDGTNASDDISDRPGWRALQELGIKSPLREAGLTKAEIIRRSLELGLSTAQKPPHACLATRIPHGTSITQEMLTRIDKAETALKMLGFSDFRIRVFHQSARLQLTLHDMQLASQNPQIVTQTIAPFFYPVFLDLSDTR